MKSISKWRTKPISPACEVVIGRVKTRFIFCDKVAVKAYPADKRGWMSLCEKHGLRHPEATSIHELILAGERFE